MLRQNFSFKLGWEGDRADGKYILWVNEEPTADLPLHLDPSIVKNGGMHLILESKIIVNNIVIVDGYMAWHSTYLMERINKSLRGDDLRSFAIKNVE